MSIVKKINELVQSYQTCEFVLVNRGIMKELGINPTIVLSELLSRLNYHASKGELDTDGDFFCTTEKLEDLTTLKYKAQAKAIHKLEELGLIKVINKKGNMRYFRIVVDKVQELVEKFSKKVAKKEKPEKPNGNSRSDQKEKPELPKRKISINKKALKKTQLKNLNNNSKPNNSSSSPREIKSENKREKMNDLFQYALEDFLQKKGFATYMIKQTVEKFVEKGITMFRLPDLEDAYQKMLEHNEKVERVICPPVFFANGVAMSLPKMPIVETKYAVTPNFENINFNWLDS